ncbi:MAG TPA: hypothetical protein VGB46_05330 [Flavisolibacter sp.]
MTRLALFLLLVLLASCSLFDKMRKSSFTYPGPAGQSTVELLVPSGYREKQTLTDSSGNLEQLYHYRGGSILYVAYLKDTAKRYQFLDTGLHIPRQLINGALVYKGMHPEWQIWKEARLGNFRVGYHFVSVDNEGRFDSAVNYSALQFKR